MSQQSASRASAASTSPTRARTSSDLTAGTVTSSADGEVRVGHPVDLAHQQRGALLLGQPADVLDQAREVLAPLRLLDRVVQRLARHLEDLGGRRRRAAQVVDAAVVRDAVQPGAQVHLAPVGAQRPVGAHEHVLHDVLGVLARAGGEHLAHVREQPLPVAVVDRAERLLAAGAEERQQLLVGAEPQPAGRRAEPGSSSVREVLRLPRRLGLQSNDPSSTTLTVLGGGSYEVRPCQACPRMAELLPIRPGLALPLSEIELRTSRSSGPGWSARQRHGLARGGVLRRRGQPDAHRRAARADLGEARPAGHGLRPGHPLPAPQPRARARAARHPAGARARGPARRAPRRGPPGPASGAGWTPRSAAARSSGPAAGPTSTSVAQPIRISFLLTNSSMP